MPTDPALSDAEHTVATAWEARRGPRRGALEQADIDAIAEAAFDAEGLKPTVELIRRIAGGGSPNTIHPKLDAWFRQGRRPSAGSAVPSELLQLWERLQGDAISSAQAALAPTLATLATEQQALLAGQAQLVTDHAALALERAATERLVVALREDFQALQARNETLQTEVTQLTEANRDAAETHTQLQIALTELRSDLTQRGVEMTRLAETLVTAQSERAAQETALTRARAGANDAEARIAELLAAAEEGAAALTAAQQLATTNALARDVAQSAAATLTTRAGQLELTLQLTEAASRAEASLRDRLSADLQREREAMACAQAAASQAGEALAASHATLDALRQENERLHALVPRQRAPGTSRTPKR